MTEDAAFDRLQAYLTRLDADAKLIDPAWTTLTRVIRSHQNAPRPTGPYAAINLLADRDLLEFDCEVYESRTVGGEPRVVLKKARGIEWLFRVEVFASAPTDYARLFRSALKSEHALVDLSPLVVRTLGEVKRAPELRQQHWEGQAILDVGLAGIAIDSLLVDVIASGTVKFKGIGIADVRRTLTYPT